METITITMNAAIGAYASALLPLHGACASVRPESGSFPKQLGWVLRTDRGDHPTDVPPAIGRSLV